MYAIAGNVVYSRHALKLEYTMCWVKLCVWAFDKRRWYNSSISSHVSPRISQNVLAPKLLLGFTHFPCCVLSRKAFKLAFELLQGTARTGCQSIIVFATDGEDNDGDPVRCGPGSYTRSGYVPGQICKYEWNKVWDEVAARNRYMSPRVSYLIV